MDEDLIKAANDYAAKHGLVVVEHLGSGMDGRVCELQSKDSPGRRALKMYRSEEAYVREKAAYERLEAHGMEELRGFVLPRVLRFDDEAIAIEMTIVCAPYLLDFASARLDYRPAFSDEVWEEWERDREERFGADWPMVKILLGDLADLGIHLLDPSPSNIRFR